MQCDFVVERAIMVIWGVPMAGDSRGCCNMATEKLNSYRGKNTHRQYKITIRPVVTPDLISVFSSGSVVEITKTLVLVDCVPLIPNQVRPVITCDNL